MQTATLIYWLWSIYTTSSQQQKLLLQMALIVAWWWYMASKIWVNFGVADGLVNDPHQPITWANADLYPIGD